MGIFEYIKITCLAIMYLNKFMFVFCNTGSRKDHAEVPSLSNMLHKSLVIHSNTIVRENGEVQSYCGLRLSEMANTSTGAH